MEIYIRNIYTITEYMAYHAWQEAPPHNILLVDKYTGGRLNKKDGLTRYGNSHVKDKTS